MARATLTQNRQWIVKKLMKALELLDRHRDFLFKKAPISPAHVSLLVDLTLVNRTQIKKINYQFRKKNRVTDVLSFPSPKFYQKQGSLGALAICYSVAREQAQQHRHEARDELLILMIHGLLHLCGWDHERSQKEAQEMQTREHWLLKKLGASLGESLISRQH